MSEGWNGLLKSLAIICAIIFVFIIAIGMTIGTKYLANMDNSYFKFDSPNDLHITMGIARTWIVAISAMVAVGSLMIAFPTPPSSINLSKETIQLINPSAYKNNDPELNFRM